MGQKCKTCGKNCEGDYCFSHKPRKKMKSQRTIKVHGGLEVRQDAMKDVYKMNKFFMKIWDKRLKRSEVSKKYLGKEALTVFFHHILPKNKYPELAYKEDNIILLTLTEHDNVECDMYKYEEVNKRREQLITKYL